MEVSGLKIHDFIDKYLFKPFNMTESYYYGEGCPDFGGDLVTTGADYEKFLHGILSYKPLSQDLVNESEKDYTPFLDDYYTLYGDYGFGHFLLCFDSYNGFTKECKDARVRNITTFSCYYSSRHSNNYDEQHTGTHGSRCVRFHSVHRSKKWILS